MLKFLGKAIVATVSVSAKICVFVYVANELAYLDHEVRELRHEVDEIKADTKG